MSRVHSVSGAMALANAAVPSIAPTPLSAVRREMPLLFCESIGFMRVN